MANKKTAKVIIKMHNPETGFFYCKAKNSKSERTAGKMKMRKYDPRVRKHVEFVETKMPK